MDQSSLQTLLETMSDHVYFQPPEKLAIEFPCIIYSSDAGDTKFADNVVHSFTQRYQITAIDRSPIGPIREKLAWTPGMLFVRFYVKDGLNHDVFTLYW